MNPVGAYRKTAGIDQLAHAMDYSYFAAVPQQHHQFLGLPPTPSHTNGVNSDDFSNGSPPVSPFYLIVTYNILTVTRRIRTISRFSMPTTTSMAAAYRSPRPLSLCTSPLHLSKMSQLRIVVRLMAIRTVKAVTAMMKT